MIAVTGANGHLGKATIGFLLNTIKPAQIVAVVRDHQKAEDLRAKGVEVRQGNYFNYSSLVQAFKGINKVLLISSSSLEERTKQHTYAIAAAKEAGVQHVIYTSVVNPSLSSRFVGAHSHFETEEYLKSSGLTYTVFRNNFYLEVIPWLIGEALQTGKIYYPAGNGKVSFAARADMAEALANVLASDGHENKIYEIGANTAYSFRDLAAALSELANKQIDYVDIPLETLKQELLKKQMPPEVVEITASVAEAIKHGEVNHPDSTLEKFLGRKPVGLKEFLKATYFNR
jgi:NAD(P)H dehydrogenase (quinone)